METPPKVLELVKTFDLHRDAYMSPSYNEAQVRRQFIDPMFEAMGWDVQNTSGYAEQYKQVVHEDSLNVGGSAKAPDYSFRLGGRRMFFLEAKRPSVNLKDDPAPAYQLRRYAWTAKLPVSILTDFEEFIVYDTRVKPEQNDKASKARILHIPCAEYPERWNEIASLFSPEAIQKGALDKYVASTSKKRGTAQVDDAFLAEIEEWRELLAKNIALRNSGLTQRDLNFAVQITIDRIVFLRICEDRRIEMYAQLMALLNGDHIYDRLRVLFERADERYNSGLFHFHKEKDRDATPDTLTPKLSIDDKVLKTIIRRLYYPDCPYEFSVLPAEILGQVYERFLGSVIRLTSGHQAKIEQKPEVRKAGGVYYTPSYIVDYIVKNTVGKLLEGKTPQQVGGLTDKWKPSKSARPLAVLDPACGSGSFLLGAYQFLLDWHLEQYAKGPEVHGKGKEPRIYEHHRGGWRLTTSERKRILLANIYGVDIDSQAVEVTKLSLLLKVLEGVDAEVLQRQLSLFHERALPDLDNNIKCGNSLIGPDFYKGKQGTFDEDEEYRINAFDWNAEFADVMKAGGFDAVIGNPPYVNAWDFFESQPLVREWINSTNHYQTADRHWDLYVLFLERALQLTRPNGKFSFIIPFSYCIQKYAMRSRRLLLTNATVESVADIRTVRVFRQVPVITIIPVVINKPQVPEGSVQIVLPDSSSTRYEVSAFRGSHSVPQAALLDQHENMWRLDLSKERLALIKKIDPLSIKLGQICYVNYGAQMSSKEKGKFGKDHVIRASQSDQNCKPVISGKELYRYEIRWAGRYVDWSCAPEMYGSRWPEFFEQPKLMIRDITGTHRVEATYDDRGFYCDHTILCAQRFCDVAAKTPPGIRQDLSEQYTLEYLAGIVASSLVSFYYYLILTGEGVRTGGGFHTYPETIRNFPIPLVSPNKSTAKARHDKMVSLVQRMLDLHKRLQGAKAAHDRTIIERQIAATDEEIDHLVYELYGLTKDEIAIVEGGESQP
jgi:predicted type IV restriction endonuclease/type I restriction-modification system DNA methylase subunit